MFTRPTSLLIGKDIIRTVAIVDGAALTVVEANVKEGEILVLDKNFKAAVAAITFALSDTIYIAEGSVDTYNYTNEAGTSVTGARRLIVSAPIEGKNVTSYAGKEYTAKSECVVTFPAITGTIVAGTEYVLKLVFKDMVEHPGLFTHTYRYIAKAGDSSQLVLTGLRNRIGKHSGARVTASGTTTLVLTGKAIPSSTSSVNSIDEFSMVQFDAILNYVDSDSNQNNVTHGTAVTKVAAKQGSGTWEQVRDLEKATIGYRGIENRIHFPVAIPDSRVVKGGAYNLITINHDRGYTTPNNQYTATTKLCTIIAINGRLANQGLALQVRLNAWMASLPQGFSALSVFAAA